MTLPVALVQVVVVPVALAVTGSRKRQVARVVVLAAEAALAAARLRLLPSF